MLAQLDRVVGFEPIGRGFESLTPRHFFMSITFKKIYSNDIKNYFNELASLRIEVFREYPYLYDGDLEYEKDYLKVYSQSSNSLLVLALSNNQIIGASTCLPLSEADNEFKKSFLNSSYSISKSFYFGESIIKKEFRGQGIGKEFFKFREEHAKKLTPDLEMTCFCSVDRDRSHPLRPEGYRELTNFWNRMGYNKQDNLKVSYEWKDIDNIMEDTKTMSVWLKKR